MATAQVCDVYGTTKKIGAFLLRLQAIPDDPSSIPETVFERQAVLCPRALKRALQLLERAVSPPRSGPSEESAKGASAPSGD